LTLIESLGLNEDESVLLADGYEDALIGTADIRSTIVAVYDANKCVEILMKRDGMSFEEATEFFEFNTLGAYVGEQTPIFVNMREP
jgi:hypothetical protein